MRYAFIALILCVCGAVRGEDAATQPAVVNHGQPASVLTADAAPAPVVAQSSPCVSQAGTCGCKRNACRTECVRGRSRVRFRTVTEGCDACTGQPVRSVTRGIVRSAGDVVAGVGEAAVNVITLPGRVCRGGRCTCN